MWNLSKYCLNDTRYEENDIMINYLFLLFMNAMSSIVSFPTSAYHTFVIEEKHGFNKQVNYQN